MTVGSTATGAYLDTSVTNGKAYYYVVTALNAAGESGNSNEAFATPTAPAPAGAATFITTDAATAGNWTGTYGAGGYMIAGDTTKLPAYAQARITTGDPYTWLASTDVTQALQKGSNPADRIAATWYRYDALSLDLNLTDGKPHQVALYFMDWGNWGLVQNVEIRDAGSGALLSTQNVSSFRDGKYLVWSVTGHVTIRCLLAGGPQVVLQGLFID